jgi:hypothetical protein
MSFEIGTRVKHSQYGIGRVVCIYNTPEHKYQEHGTNGITRYEGNLNLDVLFEKGGPRGWALYSNHDVRELEII